MLKGYFKSLVAARMLDLEAGRITSVAARKTRRATK